MPNSTIIANIQKVESKPNKSLGTKYKLMMTMVESIFIIHILNKHMDDLQDAPNPSASLYGIHEKAIKKWHLMTNHSIF